MAFVTLRNTALVEPNINMKLNNRFWENTGIFLAAVICISYGIQMIVKSEYITWTNSWTLQYTGGGGEFLILFGVAFFILFYFKLSPFGRFRKFFEKNQIKKTQRNDCKTDENQK